MALNVDEFKIYIEGIFQKIYSKLPDLATTVANDAKVLVRNRIQSKGLTAEETPFPTYTEGYKKIKVRMFKAKNTSITNLTATGDMWRNWGIIAEKIEKGKIIIEVGGRTDDSANKIDWNSERYGDITRLSK